MCDSDLTAWTRLALCPSPAAGSHLLCHCPSCAVNNRPLRNKAGSDPGGERRSKTQQQSGEQTVKMKSKGLFAPPLRLNIQRNPIIQGSAQC